VELSACLKNWTELRGETVVEVDVFNKETLHEPLLLHVFVLCRIVGYSVGRCTNVLWAARKYIRLQGGKNIYNIFFSKLIICTCKYIIESYYSLFLVSRESFKKKPSCSHLVPPALTIGKSELTADPIFKHCVWLSNRVSTTGAFDKCQLLVDTTSKTRCVFTNTNTLDTCTFSTDCR
jgi:hypothetical protein